MPLKAPTDFSHINVQILVKGDLLSQEEANSLFAAIHDALHSVKGLAGLFNMGADKPGHAPPVRVNATINSNPWPWALEVPADNIEDEQDEELSEYLSQSDVL